MTRAFMILMALSAAPVQAESAMTGAEFEAYTKGKTLTFSSAGRAYGIEEYFDDRRVRWAFLDGQCQDGYWYDVGDQICFVYELEPSPQCWTFTETPGGLKAEFFASGQDVLELFETRESREPLSCLGPDVGV